MAGAGSPAAAAAEVSGTISEPDWRTRHCAEPAIEAASSASGRDIWAELGGCPRSWREAADLYRRLGVRNLTEATTKVLGPPLASPRLAKRGDVVMAQGALGVCAGEVAIFMGATLPMRKVEKAWPAGGDNR